MEERAQAKGEAGRGLPTAELRKDDFHCDTLKRNCRQREFLPIACFNILVLFPSHQISSNVP